MTTSLGQLAEIRTGYTFRDGINFLPDGDVRVLQAKDVDHDLVINTDYLPFVDFKGSADGNTLRSGDVILTARNRFQAAVVDAKMTVVANSSVFVIRVKDGLVNAEYLAVYLNSLMVKLSLNKLSKGGLIKALHKQDLASLEILIPNKKNQKLLVGLYKNIANQRELLNKKLETNVALMEAALSRVIPN